MKHLNCPRFLVVLGAWCLTAASVSAETSLLLDTTFGVRYVPPSNVTVPSGERLIVTAPDFGPVQWTLNGQPIAGATDRVLVIPAVTPADAGSYVATYQDQPPGRTSQSLVLAVGPTQRLANLSTRAQVGAGENTFIGGFAVTGPSHKKIILRAIGPTLSEFGVENPVAEPVIAIFDERGKPYTNSYVYPAVVGGPTYESDLAESLAKTGAFPLPPGTKDVVEMRPFIPGGYTVHVSSRDGSPGIVLLEVYEVP